MKQWKNPDGTDILIHDVATKEGLHSISDERLDNIIEMAFSQLTRTNNTKDSYWSDVYAALEVELDRRNTKKMIKQARDEAKQAKQVANWSIWITAGIGLLQVFTSCVSIVANK